MSREVAGPTREVHEGERPDDRLVPLEVALGRVLTAGVRLSAALLAAGLVWWGLAGPAPLAAALLHGGLMVLLATPPLRVLVSFGVFLRRGDWFFALATLAVLLVLLTTLLVALAG